MKTVIATLLVLASSTSAFAANPVLEAMKPRVGLYELTENDAKNPCRAMGELNVGKEVRLNVVVPTESNQYQEKGDVIVSLEQYGDTINKWYSVFDRAPFFRINGWSKRYFMPMMGLWITHKSTYDHAAGFLIHSASFNSVTGSQAGVQHIHFNDEGRKFEYTYEIVDYDFLGRVVKRTDAGRCEFTRKE